MAANLIVLFNQKHQDYNKILDTPYLRADQLTSLSKSEIDKLSSEANAGNTTAMINLANWYFIQKEPSNELPAYFKRGLELLQKASETNVEAVYQLGVCYEMGNVIPKSMSTAVKWYQKASAHHDTAKCCLAVCLYSGNGIDKDIPLAVSLFKELAAKDYSRALYFLGRYYESDHPTGKTPAEFYQIACQYYKKADEKGYFPAHSKFITCSKKYEDALSASVSQQNDKSDKNESDKSDKSDNIIFTIEDTKQRENGINANNRSKSTLEIINHLEDASQKNDTRAMIQLALMILHGKKEGQKNSNAYFSNSNVNDKNNTENEFIQAYKLLLSAGHLGNADGYYILARCFEINQMNVESIAAEHVIHWYDLARRKGSLPAACRIGKYMLLGHYGLPKDQKGGFLLIDKASQEYQKLLFNEHLHLVNLVSDIKESKDEIINILEKLQNAQYGNKQNEKISNSNSQESILEELYQKDLKNEARRTFYDLAICYEQGIGIKQNYSNALQYLLLAASLDHLPSIKRTAGYLLSEVIAKNLENQAFPLLNRIFQQDPKDAENMYYLGYCHENGFGTKKDLQQAIQWYESAIDFPYAACALGVIHHDQIIADLANNVNLPKNPGHSDSKTLSEKLENSMTLFKRAAENGCFEACFFQARCYEEGYRDDKTNSDFWNKIKQLYQKAANYGYDPTNAISRLGLDEDKNQKLKRKAYYLYYSYRMFMGIQAAQLSVARKIEEIFPKQNDKRKIDNAKLTYLWIENAYGSKYYNIDESPEKEFYESSFKKDHAEIAFALINCYIGGIGLAANKKKAHELLDTLVHEKSEFIDNSQVINPYLARARNLYALFCENSGDSQDMEKALNMYHLAAKEGNSEAAHKLGVYYERQSDASQRKLANLYYTRSLAYKNESDALYNLGVIYETGSNVIKDLNLALMLYEKACEQGNADAILKLADWHRIGISTELLELQQDINKAKDLYKIARTKYLILAKRADTVSKIRIGVRIGDTYLNSNEELSRALYFYGNAEIDINNAENQKKNLPFNVKEMKEYIINKMNDVKNKLSNLQKPKELSKSDPLPFPLSSPKPRVTSNSESNSPKAESAMKLLEPTQKREFIFTMSGNLPTGTAPVFTLKSSQRSQSNSDLPSMNKKSSTINSKVSTKSKAAINISDSSLNGVTETNIPQSKDERNDDERKVAVSISKAI